METISITIPKEKEVLIKTADYLRSLAGESVAQVTSGRVEVEVPLDPRKEAGEMGDRIDRTVADAATPPVEVPHVPPTASLDVDNDGTPWDVRIHSSGKTFMATGPKVGTWKLIRGVDPALVEQVKAELLAAAGPVLNIPSVVTDEQGYAISPAETPVPVVETPPAVVPVSTYTGLITLITDQSKPGGVLQANDVKDAIAISGAGMVGVTTLPELAPAQHVAYIPLVAAELERIWATRV